MDDDYLRKIISVIFVIILMGLAVLVLRPVLISIIVAIMLAFVFNPVYDWLIKYIKNKDITILLIITFLLLIVILPMWFLTPILIKQSFSMFQAVQQIDFVSPLKSIFPSVFASQEFSTEVGYILSSFTSRTINSIVDHLAQIILNFPVLMLHFFVILFTFFFVLKEREKIISYVQSVLPFSKDVEKKFFEYSKGITSSVLYGQVIIGLVQGVITTFGFFIFQVPNSLFLGLIATLASILPIVGPSLIWVPVVIYSFLVGNVVQAWGVLIFGLIASTVDNFLRPMFVSRRTKVHQAVVLISMIGGLFFFGVLGLLIGPLIISYLLILLEIYRRKSSPGLITKS